jgi:hypothetical protein
MKLHILQGRQPLDTTDTVSQKILLEILLVFVALTVLLPRISSHLQVIYGNRACIPFCSAGFYASQKLNILTTSNCRGKEIKTILTFGISKWNIKAQHIIINR